MNIKTTIAATVLALGSMAASAAQTTPVQVQGSFSDVLLGQITLGGAANVGGATSYVTSYTLFGTQIDMPVVSFSSVSLYLNGSSVGTSNTNTFTFSNLGAGTYSLKASGSVAGGGFNFIAAQYEVTPVPEPETFAMLLAGLGVMGAIARRRKAAVAAV